jgi:four helix bundle protein
MKPKIEKFEDLEVWNNAIELSVQIYGQLKNCRDYGLRDQLCRASVSVPSNIAEGFERHHNNEYIHFLFIAKGSAGEVRTQLIIARRLEYITEQTYLELAELSRKISAQLNALIKIRKEKFSK